MKILVLVVFLLGVTLFLTGCFQQTKTVPWEKEQINKLEENKINCVPVVIWEF